MWRISTKVPAALMRKTLLSCDMDVVAAIGISIEAKQVVALLERMSLSARLSTDEKQVIVSVPPTRSGTLASVCTWCTVS